MNAPFGNALQQLRDVHAPPPPDLWPPAPGWWLLWALGLAAIAWLTARAYRRRQRALSWRAALAELERIATDSSSGDAPAQAQAIALLLRRLAMLRSADAAALPAEDLPELVFGAADEVLHAALRDRFQPGRAPADPALFAHLRLQIENAARNTLRGGGTGT